MADPWEDVVRPNLPDLVHLIKLKSLLDHLYAQKLLNDDEWEDIRLPSKTNRDKTRDLLTEILPQKGPHAYSTFVRLLIKTGQKCIVKDVLQQPLETGQIPN